MRHNLIIAIVILLFVSCKKDTDGDGLPAATTSGKGTFGCLINGRAFSAKCSGIMCSNPHVTLNPNTGGEIEISGVVGEELITMSASSAFAGANKTYTINYRLGDLGITYTPNMFNDNTKTIIVADTSCRCSGELDFTTVNTQDRIASGTFWFDAYKPGMDTIKVRKGRFDCHF